MKDRIKAVRADAKLTQAAFAEKVHVSRNYITQIEMGVMRPGDNLIRDVCREFNINEQWLRDGIGDMKTAASRAEEMATAVKRLFSDRPASFQTALVTTLLRFDPDGEEWQLLERIYESVAAEKEKGPDAS